ncbi:zinc transport system ATP-binding protein [Actinopolyspora lacussalsi subsp. righensis]|uniref:Zinc transport system ATP-binding protein n=1 Tax=Actinopolyspora righensis TaxID=995060 RepID=A0A1I6X7Y5_9ACTN|nr:ATP-binding cassette domain-containing protein [Actinopolyspora righensis]SFT34232.1 zinc transport system ATP-binding protein [Actinopolyspora righensis]
MSSTNAVTLTGVRAGYGATPVLSEVNLTLAAGEFLAVTGPNGGGKSTLLGLLVGLLRPFTGEVEIHGRSPHRARGRIGYLPQAARLDLEFPMTVRDLTAMGRIRSTWLPQRLRAADRAAVTELLRWVGLAELAARPVAALSTGQRRRVLLARALATEPDLLVLDEPEAGIDAESAERLQKLLSSLIGSMTVVVASHDIEGTASLATCGVTVDHGLTPWSGNGEQHESVRRGGDPPSNAGDRVPEHAGPIGGSM